MKIDDSVFEPGKTYRNEHGAYQVLALHGEKMTIQYENGRQQTVSIALQARIWHRIQAAEAHSPPRHPRSREDEGLETQPIAELVRRVLNTMSKPYPPDIIDQVCLAIEHDPAWLQEYHALVEHFSSQGKDGKLTVNAFIGWHVRDQTGMFTVKAGLPAQSSLIQSYSALTDSPASEPFWSRIPQLKGQTLKTLDQKRPFTIKAVLADKVIVEPHSTGKERPITRHEIEAAWQALLQHGELAMMDVKSDYSDWNPVYVTAILAKMPGVSYQIRPIVLTYKRP